MTLEQAQNLQKEMQSGNPDSVEVVHEQNCGCRCIQHGDYTTAIELCPKHNAAPEMLEALRYALDLVKVARRYFPKSVRNSDKFQLENTCAAIGKAVAKAEGR